MPIGPESHQRVKTVVQENRRKKKKKALSLFPGAYFRPPSGKENIKAQRWERGPKGSHSLGQPTCRLKSHARVRPAMQRS